jgi:signal peptidase II
VVLFTVLSDYFSKIAVMENMSLSDSIPIIKGVFHLTYITNPGAAFGSLSDARWLFMTASALLILFLTALLLLWDDKSTLFYVSTSMVLGGGIGNMIDRIFYGEVVDFLDFCAFPELWSWIFNLADSYVCVGVGLLMIYYITSEIKHAREEKEKKSKNGEG